MTTARRHASGQVLLEALLAQRLTPVVPAQGSVGASGDLAPLAHMAAAMIGVGRCRVAGETVPAAAALADAGLAPLTLAAYNAGEGRVARLLRETGGKDYDTIAARLPAETRMYVPRVIETVRRRAGTDPLALPAPG